MRGPLSLCVLLGCLWLVAPASAVIETYEFSDPALEQRYRDLSQELRCPKCQNQNIADSNAPISQDLRKQLYQQLESGASDREILDFMVARYGEFVRYRPGFTSVTAMLWLAPLLMLAIGALVLVVMLWRRRSAEGPALDERERQTLEALMHSAEKDS